MKPFKSFLKEAFVPTPAQLRSMNNLEKAGWEDGGNIGTTKIMHKVTGRVNNYWHIEPNGTANLHSKDFKTGQEWKNSVPIK